MPKSYFYKFTHTDTDANGNEIILSKSREIADSMQWNVLEYAKELFPDASLDDIDIKKMEDMVVR